MAEHKLICIAVSQTAKTGNTASSGPTQTADPTAEPTSDSGDFGLGGSGTDDSGSSESSPDSSSSSDSVSGGGGSNGGSNNTGAIVGGVVGGVGGLALIAAVVFFFWRRSRKAKIQVVTNVESDVGAGKPELDSTAAAAALASPPSSSPSPSALKGQPPSRADNVSPVSAHNTSELHGQSPAPQMSELHARQGGGSTAAAAAAAARPELPGQNSFDARAAATSNHPLYSSAGHNAQEAFSQQVYEAPVQHPTQVHEMHAQSNTTNWQSGPVLQYHEMDGGSRRT